jgi:DNA ligase-1
MKNYYKPIAIFLALFLCKNSFAESPKIQPSGLYHEGIKITEYLVSNKLDGIRARWNGSELISRNGNKFNAPKWFIEDFPKGNELDGELWVGTRRFELVSSIVRDKVPSDAEWKTVKFMVFDLPKSDQIFEERVKILKKIIKKSDSDYLHLIEQFEVLTHDKLSQKLYEVRHRGGEGLMLHKKDSLYKFKKSDDLLKLKPYFDAEAVVISHIAGHGRLEGIMGALLMEGDDEIRFRIGSGFSDAQRANPPKVGSRVTYKFYGKTKNGLPRFPVFLRIRNQ